MSRKDKPIETTVDEMLALFDAIPIANGVAHLSRI